MDRVLFYHLKFCFKCWFSWSGKFPPEDSYLLPFSDCKIYDSHVICLCIVRLQQFGLPLWIKIVRHALNPWGKELPIYNGKTESNWSYLTLINSRTSFFRAASQQRQLITWTPSLRVSRDQFQPETSWQARKSKKPFRLLWFNWIQNRQLYFRPEKDKISNVDFLGKHASLSIGILTQRYLVLFPRLFFRIYLNRDFTFALIIW